MNHNRLLSQMVSLTLVVLLLSTACGTSQPAPTPVPPTLTPAPPTAVQAPTATQAPAATATLSPVETGSPNPAARAYTAMAYDAESDRVILFGGQTGDYHDLSNHNGATWAYDVAANQWTQMTPSMGPARRSAAELAYDAESDRIILFGGGVFNNERFRSKNDTWAYDYNTNTWTEMAAKGPANHIGARLSYDAESDRVILFGGYDLQGWYYNDTWAYDFNTDTWTEMKPSTSPPGRNYQAMAYDAKFDRVLTWAGLDDPLDPLNESVWSYDFNTNTWQETKPSGRPLPTAHIYPVMVYDNESGRMVVYGGYPKPSDETWTYQYETNIWTKLKPATNPGELSRHIMVYSTATDRIVLFGGQIGYSEFDYTGKTWTYDLNSDTWTEVTPNP